ncbi:Uncharacterised protein [uncultured archaeon]|nr:Uncharacterised protein [uncultured archaeon]
MVVMNLSNLKITFIPEENLIFGGNQEEKDPRIGLKYFGPYRYSSESTAFETIRAGIVGNKSVIEKIKDIHRLITNPVQSLESNKWLYPEFPGMSRASNFNCSLDLSGNWQETILNSEIERITKIKDVNERIGAAVVLYLGKIENIMEEDNHPHVIICGVPNEVEDYCGISERTRGAKTPKPSTLEKEIQRLKAKNQQFLQEWGLVIDEEKEEKAKGFDFRNALKGRVMGLKSPAPIQLLRESTADSILNYSPLQKRRTQDPASFAWNFSTALYYKANGKPWRLAKLRQDTCFVGISFYRDKMSFNKDMQTSMAQVFTHNGEGLVLRGNEVYIDEKTKEPHLSEKQAQELMDAALQMYNRKAGRTPSRAVIHKSTLFTKAEKDGFSKAIGDLKRDFVTISRRNREIRFMRMGSYPVLRGTLISLTEDEHILFTAGYIPRLRTYPGHRIPSPLMIIHDGDTEIVEVCREILGLTKLNWNTTAFSTDLPITLKFSDRVGRILSEHDSSSPLQNHYKFYM